MPKTTLFSIATFLFSLILSLQAQAQNSCKVFVDGAKKGQIPSTVTVIVPAAAGNSSDLAARVINEAVTQNLKKMGIDTAIVVENKPQASGAVGASTLKNAGDRALNGSMLMFVQAPILTVNPYLKVPKPTYTADDFEPVAYAGAIPYAIFCNREKYGKYTIDQLVSHIKTKGIAYSSGGVSNYTNLLMMQFGEAYKIPKDKLLHVPYNGTSPAMKGVQGGEVDCMFQSIPGAAGELQNPGHQGLRMIALGSTVSADRNITQFCATKETPSKPAQPGTKIPPLSKSFGEMLNWGGYVAKKGTDQDFVKCFNEQVQAALQTAEVQKKLVEENGFIIDKKKDPATPEAFGKFIKNDKKLGVFALKLNGEPVSTIPAKAPAPAK